MELNDDSYRTKLYTITETLYNKTINFKSYIDYLMPFAFVIIKHLSPIYLLDKVYYSFLHFIYGLCYMVLNKRH